MMEYRDEAGEYSGGLLEGVPHGEGLKFYSQGIYFEGNWENGAKSGIGFYICDDIRYCFEFSEGKISKVLCENEDANLLKILAFDRKIRVEFNGKNFTEKIVETGESLDEIMEEILGRGVGKGFKGEWRYEGSFLNNKAEGFGRFFYGNELDYDGEWHDGFKSGKGRQFKAGKLIYEGEFLEGKFHGIGTGYQKDSTITGEFRYGLPEGKIVMQSDKLRYEGEVKDKLFHGQGKEETSSYTYTGEFKYGQRDGYGVLESNMSEKNSFPGAKYVLKICSNFKKLGSGLPSGEIFEKDLPIQNQTEIGLFKKNRLVDGKIIMKLPLDLTMIFHYYSNGCKGLSFMDFKGVKSMVNIKKTGSTAPFIDTENMLEYEKNFEQCLVRKTKSIKLKEGIYAGEISEGEISGKGKIIFSNCEVYRGNFKHSLMDGFGVYSYLDGTTYTGEFKFGLKEGVGSLSFPDKTVIRGTWKQDKLDGRSKILKPGLSLEVFWHNGVLLKYSKCFKSGHYFLSEILK